MVMSNLKFLVEIFGSLECSRSHSDGRRLVACDSGTGSAYENYALLYSNDGCARDPVSNGISFFSERGSSHIWPLFPGLHDGVVTALESAGARLDDTFFGMTARLVSEYPLSADDVSGFENCWMSNGHDVEEWADAVWDGFDSGERTPAAFRRFASEASERDEISVFGLRRNRTVSFAATGLICAVGGVAGVYYISTRPKFRRRGLGSLVMKALMDRAREMGCEYSCLLATPAGRPLYLKCGYAEVCEVTIMIHDGARPS
jgi:GNAT superfamily N-acetyltransferase